MQIYFDTVASSVATKERKIRTRMFVASSFSRNIAEGFADEWYDMNDAASAGKVLFRFQFERHRCLHVNYIDKSGFPGEKEFLLPPYTGLELQEVKESHDHKAGKPHIITLKVCVDNQAWPLDAKLAGWI